MHRTIVIAFATLDGIIDDPDGSQGTPNGGWAFRRGPESVAGDKFKLGPILDTGTLLLGRKTWQVFSHIWPNRTDEFSTAMNQIPKLVATRTVTDVSAWSEFGDPRRRPVRSRRTAQGPRRRHRRRQRQPRPRPGRTRPRR